MPGILYEPLPWDDLYLLDGLVLVTRDRFFDSPGPGPVGLGSVLTEDLAAAADEDGLLAGFDRINVGCLAVLRYLGAVVVGADLRVESCRSVGDHPLLW
ncbi:hypothetical protein ACQPYE_17820 [Actinosynnema sp. CA-299493]